MVKIDWNLILWGGNCCNINSCNTICSVLGIGWIFVAIIIALIIFFIGDYLRLRLWYYNHLKEIKAKLK